MGTDLVSKDYYDCINICRPNKADSLTYWDMFICDANCAGASLMTI